MQKISEWVQIATGIAVLIGLGLVIYELRQTRDVALAQLSSDGFDHFQQRVIAEMGENPATTLAKLCAGLTSLSDEELIVLSAYYENHLLNAFRAYRIAQRTGFYDGAWRQIVEDQFPAILSSAIGRAWWEEEKRWYPEDFRRAADEVDISGLSSCGIGPWKERMSDAS